METFFISCVKVGWSSFLWLSIGVLRVLCFLFGVGFLRLLFSIRERYPNPLEDISILKKGDIILTGKQSIKYSPAIQLSNVITRKLKHRFWTHAAIYKGDGKLLEAQPEGIIEKDIKAYLEGGFIIRAYRHKYADEKTIDDVVEFCQEKKDENCRYGTRGLIFYIVSTFMPFIPLFNWLLDNRLMDKICDLDNAYFCSELIVEAFESTGHPISPYDGWRVKPTDFIGNPFLIAVESSK